MKWKFFDNTALHDDHLFSYFVNIRAASTHIGAFPELAEAILYGLDMTRMCNGPVR